MPSCLPLSARLNMSASVQWGCVSSVLPQAQRSAGAAGSRSCLLAETDTGTRLRLSSYSNPVSLWSISSNLFLSALSITSIRILVFSKELPQLGLVFLHPPVSVLSVQFKALWLYTFEVRILCKCELPGAFRRERLQQSCLASVIQTQEKDLHLLDR